MKTFCIDCKKEKANRYAKRCRSCFRKAPVSLEHRMAVSMGMRKKRDVDNMYIINEDGCWIWQGAFEEAGYGSFNRDGIHGAHRYFYIKYKGSVPKGKHLDHLCRVRACVNPNHLEIVSVAENIRRGLAAKLNWAKVSEIRSLYKSEGYSQKMLAEIYRVGQDQISRIINERRWIIK